MGTRHIAEWLVKRAALRLPEGVGEQCCREWLAEIPAILEDPGVRAGWRRSFRALWFAVDQWRGLRGLAAACRSQAQDGAGDGMQAPRAQQLVRVTKTLVVSWRVERSETDHLALAMERALSESRWRENHALPGFGASRDE